MNRVARILLAGVSAVSMTLPVVSQDLAQAESTWYTDADAKLQAMIDMQPNTGTAKNVILFVADGQGVGSNYAIRLFAGQLEGKLGEEHVLPYEEYPYTALIKTYNINAQTPDSAPTAGSMNTGVKQIFNTINLSEAGVNKDCASEEGNKLTTFSEIVTGMGKSVGIVSTARITHATPAAVYAKTADRNWEGEAPEGCTDIAQQLFDAMSAGTVDLAFGGGSRYFAPKDVETMDGGKGRRIDGRNLIEEAQAAGAQYAYDTASFNALKLDGSTPVLGLFEDSHMKYEYDRADDDEPSLTDLTKAAIEQLSQNGGGFYLEVEAGRVDHANHAGNAYRRRCVQYSINPAWPTQ